MDNKHPEAIPVEVGGKTRLLKIGPAAFRIAEIRHGIQLSAEQLASPGLGTLAQLFYIGLLPDEPDLEEMTVLQWMAETNEGPLLKQVGKALERMTAELDEAFDSGAGGNVKGAKKPQKRSQTSSA